MALAEIDIVNQDGSKETLSVEGGSLDEVRHRCALEEQRQRQRGVVRFNVRQIDPVPEVPTEVQDAQPIG